MINAIPWDEISQPDADYNVRRISSPSSIDIYWGKDSTGSCLLILELVGDHASQFRRDAISVHGIKADLRMGGQGNLQRLILKLERHVDRDVFHGLCETLIAHLAEVKDSSIAMAVALSTLKRWKAFFAGGKIRSLSDQEVRGLFAELWFLRLLYQKSLSQDDAIQAWSGPDRSHQDFRFADYAIEIKSFHGDERNSVRISSEDQLETLAEKLFLVVMRLTASTNSGSALSLNELVLQIGGELTSQQAIDSFESKVAASGYVPSRDYDAPLFIVRDIKAYRVVDAFPKLIRSRLPTGIDRISYEIRLETIAPFQCELSEIFGVP